MDTFDMLIDATTAVDTLSTLTEREHAREPFTCELGGETTHHATFEAVCKYVVDKLGPAHLVMRRDFGARRIGVWVEQYDVTTEPAAYITWAKGTKL